jgi:hypothetical protein
VPETQLHTTEFRFLLKPLRIKEEEWDRETKAVVVRAKLYYEPFFMSEENSACVIGDYAPSDLGRNH